MDILRTPKILGVPDDVQRGKVFDNQKDGVVLPYPLPKPHLNLYENTN